MSERRGKLRTELHVAQLLPNMLTIAAICAGLTAIRFGILGNFERAALLVIAAGVLDGLDGRLARRLNSSSKMGAELDSLADFLNFGVATPLVVYFWALQDVKSFGWIAVLVFSVCCVLRLARFNVSAKTENTEESSGYFVGVPAPAGAGLIMLPMFLSFEFSDGPIIAPTIIAFYMIGIGFLLISRIRTWSFKALTVSRHNAKFLLVGSAFIGAMIITYGWITLFVIGFTYIVMVVWSLVTGKAASSVIEDITKDDDADTE